ncbi:MAG: hypothetical protein IBX55_12105 [Methyloprofundus sp.]|nr:hypothetical protein [Methyloprofundus sp.]
MFQIFNEGKEDEFMLNLKCGVMISKTKDGKAWVDSGQLGTSTGVDDSYESVKASILEKERKARIEKMATHFFAAKLQNENVYDAKSYADAVIALAETMVDRIDVKYGY